MQINPFDTLSTEPLSINKPCLDATMAKGDFVVALVTATKPDFYKQAPLVPAAKRRGVPLFVLNTGQHFDNLLGFGLKEFGIENDIAIDLNIRGDLSQKTVELVLKLQHVCRFLEQNYPEKTVLPLVHGDTHAAAIVPMAWLFASNLKAAQNEAGLRSMAPIYKNHKNFPKFIADQFSSRWSINRAEPFPEQYDTFVSAAACHLMFAPVELNRQNLLREGYPEDAVFTVGNSVVDAVALKRQKADSVFSTYPQLEQGEWIRVDIHRRENLTPSRFKNIVGAVKKLVATGHKVVLIELTATKTALDTYGLRADLEKLGKNFLLTPLWQKYGHVIEFLESGHCAAELTDSGSMQEELNEIRKPLCLTCRFTTDRPETVFDSHSNLLVPPISPAYLANLVNFILKNDSLCQKLRRGKRLYGRNVADKIMKILAKRQERPFTWAHDSLGFKFDDRSLKYL